MYFIRPYQSYSFRCWFPNNSVITFLEGCFPSSFMAEVVIFFSIVYSRIYLLLFISSGGIVRLLPSPITSFCEDCVLFMLIHLTGVLCHLLNFFSSYQVFPSSFSRSAAQIISTLFLLYLVLTGVVSISILSLNLLILVVSLVPLF